MCMVGFLAAVLASLLMRSTTVRLSAASFFTSHCTSHHSNIRAAIVPLFRER